MDFCQIRQDRVTLACWHASRDGFADQVQAGDAKRIIDRVVTTVTVARAVCEAGDSDGLYLRTIYICLAGY